MRLQILRDVLIDLADRRAQVGRGARFGVTLRGREHNDRNGNTGQHRGSEDAQHPPADVSDGNDHELRSSGTGMVAPYIGELIGFVSYTCRPSGGEDGSRDHIVHRLLWGLTAIAL